MNNNLIIIIPVLNEGLSIYHVIKTCQKYSDIIIVLNDGSKDNSRSEALRAGAIVYNHKRTMGVGRTIRDLYLIAKKYGNQESIIINLDGDGQHIPDYIPQFCDPIINKRADLVIGSRFLSEKENEMYFIRKFGNKFFSFLISLFIHQKLTDAQSGFRAITMGKIAKLNLIQDYTNRQELILLAHKQRYKILEIPIISNPRKHGKSFLDSPFKKLKYFFMVNRSIFFTQFFRK
jgi:glycosyltransferase involved in cell wall biosynthesis